MRPLSKTLLNTSFKVKAHKQTTFLRSTSNISFAKYSTLFGPEDIPKLIPSEYRTYPGWSTQQVFDVLCSPVKDGGASIDKQDIQPLLERKFGGENLVCLVNLMKNNNSKLAKEYLNSYFENVDIPSVDVTCFKILVWIQNKLIDGLINPSRKVKLLRDFFGCGNQIINKTPTKGLVQSFGKDFLLKNVEEKVANFSSTIHKMIKHLTETKDIDKQIFQIFFIASAPGTGKSRLNQELRSLSIEYLKSNMNLSDKQKKYLDNSVHIMTSFKNSTPYYMNKETSPINILTSRILYSYFSRERESFPFTRFVAHCQDLYFCSILEAISVVRKDREESKLLEKEEPLIIFFSIDEFQDMINGRQFLDTQVRELCSTMYSSWKDIKVILIPIFSGLSWYEMDRLLRKSTFSYQDIPTSSIDMVGIEEIAKHVFNKYGIPERLVFEDKLVYSYLKKTYGHPRLLEKTLEFLVFKYTQNPSHHFGKDDTFQLIDLLNQFNLADISVDVAKIILAHTIIGTNVTYELEIGDYKIKDLDDKGILKLEKKGGSYNIVMSWYQLTSLVSLLPDNKRKLWLQFLKSMDDCMTFPNINLYDYPFKKFHVLFDMILNECFCYLGSDRLPVEDRLRGFSYSLNETNLCNKLELGVEKFDTEDYRTDMEIYFGTYVYNLVFTYLPKKIHFSNLDSNMVSRLFGVSVKNMDKRVLNQSFSNLDELLDYFNTHTKNKNEQIRLLYDVEIIFD
ncbi:hypothetical protein ABK040_000118 [Willaertia magna]